MIGDADEDNRRRIDLAIPDIRSFNQILRVQCVNKMEADDLQEYVKMNHPDMVEQVQFTWLTFR